jgi:hypothetical protein
MNGWVPNIGTMLLTRKKYTGRDWYQCHLVHQIRTGMTSHPASLATGLSNESPIKVVSHSSTCLHLVMESRHSGACEVTSDYIHNPTLSYCTVQVPMGNIRRLQLKGFHCSTLKQEWQINATLVTNWTLASFRNNRCEVRVLSCSAGEQ